MESPSESPGLLDKFDSVIEKMNCRTSAQMIQKVMMICQFILHDDFIKLMKLSTGEIKPFESRIDVFFSPIPRYWCRD